jgi:tetratricopeptide (TPR) repeat protein
MPMRWLPIAGLLLACAGATPAVAAEPSDAERLYLEGLDLYQRRQYDKAITAYLRGYSLSRRPGFLYNIALAYSKKGDCRAASEYYRRYLEREARTPLRSRVDAELARLQGCVAEQARRRARHATAPASFYFAPSDDLTPRRPPLHPPPRRRSWGGVATTGAGLALLVAGSVLALTASAEYGRIEAECAPTCSRERWEGFQTRERVGVGLLVAGGVTTVAGVTWWVLNGRRPATPRARESAAAPALRISF